jgi:hypothetical protein
MGDDNGNPVLARLRGMKVRPAEEIRAEDEAKAAEEYRANLHRRAGPAGLPGAGDLRRVALGDDVRETPALAALADALVKREAAKTEWGPAPLLLVLGGPPGTGKSCAMARCVVRHRKPARYVAATEVSATRRDWSTADTWREWLSGADLLALDDLGEETGDPAVLRALMTERWNHGLATVASSNLSRADFAARYFDARLTDRAVREQAARGVRWYALAAGESLRGGAR